MWKNTENIYINLIFCFISFFTLNEINFICFSKAILFLIVDDGLEDVVYTVIRLGDCKRQCPEVYDTQNWEDICSFLVYDLANDKVNIVSFHWFIKWNTGIFPFILCVHLLFIVLFFYPRKQNTFTLYIYDQYKSNT